MRRRTNVRRQSDQLASGELVFPSDVDQEHHAIVGPIQPLRNQPRVSGSNGRLMREARAREAEDAPGKRRPRHCGRVTPSSAPHGNLAQTSGDIHNRARRLARDLDPRLSLMRSVGWTAGTVRPLGGDPVCAGQSALLRDSSSLLRSSPRRVSLAAISRGSSQAQDGTARVGGVGVIVDEGHVAVRDPSVILAVVGSRGALLVR